MSGSGSSRGCDFVKYFVIVTSLRLATMCSLISRGVSVSDKNSRMVLIMPGVIAYWWDQSKIDMKMPLSYFEIAEYFPNPPLIPRLEIVKTLHISIYCIYPSIPLILRASGCHSMMDRDLLLLSESRTFLLKCQCDMKQTPITPDQMTDIIYIQSILKRVKLFRIWCLFFSSFVFNIQLLAYWWTYQSNKPWRSL